KCALAFAGATAGFGAWLSLGAWPGQPIQALALGAAAAAAAYLGTVDSRRAMVDTAAMPLSLAVEFVALLCFGPGAMTFVAVRVVAARTAVEANSRGSRRLLAGVAVAIIATQASGAAHAVLGGERAGHLTWPWQGIPILAAVVAYSLVRGGWSIIAEDSSAGAFEWRERIAGGLNAVPAAAMARRAPPPLLPPPP